MIKTRAFHIILLVFALVLSLIPMHVSVDAALTDMLKITITVFALARALNAILSVAQGTELSIEPMGVGLTLTPGEILDPLNDLIEQFSSVLLLASASLGMQQIVLILSDKPLVQYGLSGLICLALLMQCLTMVSDKWKQQCLKWIVFLTILRLLVPVAVLVSYQVQTALTQQREQALDVLETTRSDVEEFNTQQAQTDDSWWDGIKNTLNLEQDLNAIEKRSETAVEAAVYLLAEFVLVMVLLPILCLYLFIRLFNKLLST